MANRVKTFKEEHALGMCNETIKGFFAGFHRPGGGARDGSCVGFLLYLFLAYVCESLWLSFWCREAAGGGCSDP